MQRINFQINFQKSMVGLQNSSLVFSSKVGEDNQPDNLPKCLGGADKLKRWVDENSVDSIVFSNSPSSNKNQ